MATKKSELSRLIESLQIMEKYDKKGKSYIEISGEECLAICDIEPNAMTIADRKAILDLGVFYLISYEELGAMHFCTQEQREDGDIWTFDENFNVLTKGDS